MTGFPPAAGARLLMSPWPGNVRELAHTLEAAVVCSERGVIDSVALQPLLIPLRGPASLHTAETPSGRYSFLCSAAAAYAQIQEALRIWPFCWQRAEGGT